MKKLGKTYAVLAFLSMVIIPLGLMHLVLPPFWGNPGISAKVDFLERKGGEYDRLFIGSSHIYRQVSPALFDSIMQDGAKSFNLGYASTSSPEGEVICESILKDNRIRVKEVFVELSPFLIFKEPQLKSCRFWYMVGPDVWWNSVNHAMGMQWIPFWERFSYAKGVTIAFTKSMFLPGLVSQWTGRDVKPPERVFGPAGDGYMPLELDYRLDPTEGMGNRQVALAADTLILKRRSKRIRSFYDSAAGTELSQAYHAILVRLIELGEKRGVKVNFILPPLITSRGQLAIYRALPEDRRIDLCDPSKYPEFYLTANAFDKGHLNTRGSRLFTAALANEVKRMRTIGEQRQ